MLSLYVSVHFSHYSTALAVWRFPVESFSPSCLFVNEWSSVVHPSALALSSTSPSICSLCSSVLSIGIGFTCKPDGHRCRQHLQFGQTRSWILNTTPELSHQIWLNAEVSSWSSHCSFSDYSMWREHHVAIALVGPTDPDSFHPLPAKEGQSAI